jgi:hypothetical protein
MYGFFRTDLTNFRKLYCFFPCFFGNCGLFYPEINQGGGVLIQCNRLQYFKAWYIELNPVAVGWLVGGGL